VAQRVDDCAQHLGWRRLAARRERASHAAAHHQRARAQQRLRRAIVSGSQRGKSRQHAQRAGAQACRGRGRLRQLRQRLKRGERGEQVAAWRRAEVELRQQAGQQAGVRDGGGGSRSRVRDARSKLAHAQAHRRAAVASERAQTVRRRQRRRQSSGRAGGG
jgi:hypothetical protein